MAVNALDDVSHWFGSDLGLSPTGDLGRVNQNLRSQQRVIRRLMTNPGDYSSHPTYGGGLGRFVGSLEDDATIIGVIKGQLRLEASVAASPAPTVTLVQIANGIAVSINYVSLPDQQPVALKFDVSA